jgi:hypothetical protein
MERHIGAHLTKYIRLPMFDNTSREHREIAELSKKAHLSNSEDEVSVIQQSVDRLAGKILGLAPDDLKQVNADLAILLD